MIPKKFYQSVILLLTFINCFTSFGQTFSIDTLQFKGDADKLINIVIMGDGYTKDEMHYFKDDATSFVNYLFHTEPFTQYYNFFNVFTINTISEESGAIHLCEADDCPDEAVEIHANRPRYNGFSRNATVPQSNPNTIFGSSFDNWGIHRLVIPLKEKVIDEILSTHIPHHDMVVILVNSPYYGGSGGKYATATVNIKSHDIMVHEIAHSFGKISDEYWAGNQYAYPGPNMTQDANPNTISWKEWLGTDGIGIYSYGAKESKSQWFRPHQYCKMQYLSAPFCSVCKESFVHQIHKNSKLILEATNEQQKFNLVLSKPMPNTIKINWFLNDVLIAKDSETIYINEGLYHAGTNVVRAEVTDLTPFIRRPEYLNPTETYEWSISRNTITKLSPPRFIWGDTLETCVNGYQVINVEHPEAGVEYYFYDSLSSNTPLTIGNYYVTPKIDTNQVYYVEARFGTMVSERSAIHLKILEHIAKPSDYRIKKDSKRNKLIIEVKKKLGEDYLYSWVNFEGMPIIMCDEFQKLEDCKNGQDGKIEIDFNSVPPVIYLRVINKKTTCSSEVVEIRISN